MSIIKPEPKQYPHEYNPEDKLDQLALGLERKLSQCIYDRGAIDTRMVEDLRNYHGQYPEDKTADQTEKKRANPFIKLTRAKTNAGEAQLVDLLFPRSLQIFLLFFYLQMQSKIHELFPLSHIHKLQHHKNE